LGKERDIPSDKLGHRITYKHVAADRHTPRAAEIRSESLARFCPWFIFCQETAGNINSVFSNKNTNT
jgi:hypothetical protein